MWTCVLVVAILYWIHTVKSDFPAPDLYDGIECINMSWCFTKGMVFTTTSRIGSFSPTWGSLGAGTWGREQTQTSSLNRGVGVDIRMVCVGRWDARLWAAMRKQYRIIKGKNSHSASATRYGLHCLKKKWNFYRISISNNVEISYFPVFNVSKDIPYLSG